METLDQYSGRNSFYSSFINRIIKQGQLTYDDLDYLGQRNPSQIDLILDELNDKRFKLKAKIAKARFVINHIKSKYKVEDENIEDIPLRYNRKLDELLKDTTTSTAELDRFVLQQVPYNVVFNAMQSDLVNLNFELSMLEQLITEFKLLKKKGVKKYTEDLENSSLNIKLTRATITLSLLLVTYQLDNCSSNQNDNNSRDNIAEQVQSE